MPARGRYATQARTISRMTATRNSQPAGSDRMACSGGRRSAPVRGWALWTISAQLYTRQPPPL